MKFEKSELKYLFMSYLMIAVLGIISGVSSINAYISNLSPIAQFLIMNLAIYFVFFFLIKGFSLGTGKKRFFVGALGSVLAFLSMDLLLPEYHVNTLGQLIQGGVFGMSASDYFFGYIYSLTGASGFFLWLLTYPITFTILFIVGSYLIDNFIKNQI